MTSTLSFVAGVALGDIDARFVQQAWHLRPWSAVTPRSFAWKMWHVVTCTLSLWQAWRLVTPTSLSCGRRGAYGTGLTLVARLVACGRCDAAVFCVADVARVAGAALTALG